MAFRELDYQRRALDALDAYLERLGEEKANADEVEALFASKPHLRPVLPDFPTVAWDRLKADKGVPGGRDYSPRVSGDGRPVPNITLKVPTGGGKTYLACAALSRVLQRFVGSNAGMVLWIVPNEAIYAQTLKALRDRDHPYRQTLDRAAAGKVKVMEKGEPLHRADLDAQLCVMVLMLQSSNRENKDSLRLFRDRGDVHGFVPGDGEQDRHAALRAAVGNLDAYDLGDAPVAWPMIKASMGNAMRIVRPIVVMDEGHRGVSVLAHKTLYGFNPRFVLELTATPKNAKRDGQTVRTANILCEVTGRELQREGMIKMPMNVAALPGSEWQATLARAWAKLEELEREARAYEGEGGRYIRPILLVQVERTGAEARDGGFIHADDARDWLKGVAGLDEEAVAYKTAERNDLDLPQNCDLLSPRCRVRAIITKAALAEGWDCPFAYVLCALAANGNEGAMTQLVGRVLRQPHATKTDVAMLDECYVFAHRADTRATVEAIKRGLEGDGLGDLASDVVLGGGTGETGDGRRRIGPRDAFRTTDIALPQVLAIEPSGHTRPLDAETDLFPMVDWNALDLDALAARLPKDARPRDAALVRLHAGDRGVEAEEATAPIPTEARFDAAYAVRTIADLVPNAFMAWALIDGLLRRLRALGWDDALIGRLAAFLVDELRKVLEAERDRQAASLFTEGLATGALQFALRGDGGDWRAPAELLTAQPVGASQLQADAGGTLARSLFLPIYAADLNGEEQRFALYLDKDAAVRWWHRNGVGHGSYALRGWRRGNVYPDFLFAALRDGGQDGVVVIETKGEQLAGNHDTAYKAALLGALTDAFKVGGATGLSLERAPFDFGAAVVLFGDMNARLPALIRAESPVAAA